MTFNRNVAWITLSEALWSLGMSFIAFDILSALIYAMGGSATLVAIAYATSVGLGYVPQLFVPYLQQRIRHCIGGAALGQGIIVLGYAAAAVALAVTTSKPVIRSVTAAAVVVAALGNALAAPLYQQVRIRLFPPQARSASYSTTIFAAMIATTFGAALTIPLLTMNGRPSQSNYFWCFVVAVAIGTLATFCFAFLRDPHPPEPAAANARPMSAFIHEFVEIFRGNRNLRIFLLSEWMHWLSALGTVFITYYAVGLFGEHIAAECGFVRSLAMIVTVPIGHYVVTRFGSRTAIIIFYILTIAMLFMLVLMASRFVILASAFITGVTLIFRVNYMFHFIAALCPDADKSKYYALCATVAGPATLLGPFLGSVLIKITGNYQTLFAIAILPLLAGLYLTSRKLQDPGMPSEAPIMNARFRRIP